MESITAKRPRTVIDHILEHGYITTEQLSDLYGYQHPPRAARDVREYGVPLETFRVKSSDGRTIAAYRFGDIPTIEAGSFTGRIPFPKSFKDRLVDVQGEYCSVFRSEREGRYLQIDHRIPYAVVGDSEIDPLALKVDDYMLLCSLCNRSKSWSCEYCENSQTVLDRTVCECCYWASPSRYSHIALSEIRRLVVVWEGDDVEMYDLLLVVAGEAGIDAAEYARESIKNAIHRDSNRNSGQVTRL